MVPLRDHLRPHEDRALACGEALEGREELRRRARGVPVQDVNHRPGVKLPH